MPGPVPKDAKIRQRRNRVSTSATLAREKGRRQRAPRLPKYRDEDGREVTWHRMTVAWWRDIWHSPMAAQFLEADIHALYRLAVLVNKYWREPSKDLAGEIRLEQQAFGLTPIDRRRLQWTVETEDERARTREVRRPAGGAAEPVGATEPQTEDPRKLLRMVAGR